MQDGTFPKKVKLNTRCAGWRESMVEEWLRNPVFYSADEGEELFTRPKQLPGSGRARLRLLLQPRSSSSRSPRQYQYDRH
jgi:hypothetical protein